MSSDEAEASELGATNTNCGSESFETPMQPPISPRAQLVRSVTQESHLTQSRTWTSPEFQKVKDFNRMKEKLHYLGLGNSPFLPETPGELVGLKAEMLAEKANRIAAGVREKERLADRRGRGLLPDEPQLFGGKKMGDGLSAVFSLNMVWSDSMVTETASQDNTSDQQNSSWPTLAEYKAWGTTLPLPRSILRAAEAEMAEKEASWLNPETLGHWGLITIANTTIRLSSD